MRAARHCFRLCDERGLVFAQEPFRGEIELFPTGRIPRIDRPLQFPVTLDQENAALVAVSPVPQPHQLLEAGILRAGDFFGRHWNERGAGPRSLQPGKRSGRAKMRLVSRRADVFRHGVGKNRKFNDQPFAYHAEIELEIATLTNLGSGLGRVILPGARIRRRCGRMVPFALPGERVRVRVFRNHKNYSEADLMAVLSGSPSRVAPRCAIYGRCGGCQYQHLGLSGAVGVEAARQVAELLEHMAGLSFPV